MTLFPLWLLSALPWIVLAVGLAGLVTAVGLAGRSAGLHRRYLLLGGIAVSALLGIYVTLVWAGVLSDRYLRVERPAAVVLVIAGAVFVGWRLAGWQRHQSVGRRRLVDAFAMAATLCTGLLMTGMDLGRPMDRLTVLVAVDRSRSIDLVPDADSRLRIELQIAENGMRDKDRIGTVAFASDAFTEDPPRVKSQLPMPHQVNLGRDGTDIGAAIRRSLAEVPSDSAARIVIVSDGVSNRGDPIAAAAAAVAADVPVDTVVLDQHEVNDVRVVALRMPPRLNQGETLDLHLVTASSKDADIEIRIKRDGVLVARSSARISAGEDLLRIRQPAVDPGLHRYDVEVTAKNPELDQTAEDNAASAFVRVRGPSVALVLDGEPGKGRFLADALRASSYVVHEGTAASVPGDLAGWALYDVVFLSDIAAPMLTPTQIDALAAYVRDLGGGLVLMGGDKSMGPGGYSQTPIEQVSPVSFDIKQDRRRASLAEIIAIDYSGSMTMHAGRQTKLELANEAAARSAALLGAGDRLGVMHVDTAVTWTVPLGPITDQNKIAAAIRAVAPGGGGIYVDITLTAAYRALEREAVNLKHVLLFSDGDDAEQLAGCRALVANAKARGITTSVVALGQGKDVRELEHLSKLGDGRFYLVQDAQRLPTVFTQETVLAARSSLVEKNFRVDLGMSGAATAGIDFGQAPELRGYVVTVPKPRASVLLTGPENDPIAATWSVGVGRAAAFTSDLKDRWGAAWTHWPGASKFVAQLARDVNRAADDPRVRLQADTSGGVLHVRADVVDEEGRQQSFRRLKARVANPDGSVQELELEPVGSGAYVATKALTRPGTYVVSAIDELDAKVSATTAAVLTTGEEMRPTGSDRALLARISSMTGGKVRDTLAGVFADRSVLRFSYDALSPWLAALAAALLLAAVASRRLSLPTRRKRKDSSARKNASAVASRPATAMATASAMPPPSGATTPATQERAAQAPAPMPPEAGAAAAAGTAATAHDTLSHLGRAKQRWRAAQPGQPPSLAPTAPLTEPFAGPVPGAPQSPTGYHALYDPAARRTVGAPARPSGAPSSERVTGPGKRRPMTAAEILLQRRKNRPR